MTMRQKRNLAGVAGIISVAALILLVTVVVARSYSADWGREYQIEMTAHCMSFQIANLPAGTESSDNPMLRLRAGQQVAILLRNEDQGMKHDLAIPKLGLQTRALAYGETATVRFTAPESGAYEYLCTIHPTIMRGQIRIIP